MCARQQRKYTQNKNRANNHRTAAIPRHLTTQARDTEMPANLNSQTTAQAAHKQHKLPIYQRQTKEKNTINILVLFCFVSFILPSVSVYLDGLRENSCYFFPSHWIRLHYKHWNNNQYMKISVSCTHHFHVSAYLITMELLLFCTHIIPLHSRCARKL